jgi:hypothetical protein
MEATVQGELDLVEQLALTASRAGEQHREEAVRAATSHASVALTTMLHVGLVSRAEEGEWRERLGRALGDWKRLERRNFTITLHGNSPREPTDDERARSAYSACRGLSVSRLAWVHHTAATESVIAEALAVEASDPESVRRACELGFADRGNEPVTSHELYVPDAPLLRRDAGPALHKVRVQATPLLTAQHSWHVFGDGVHDDYDAFSAVLDADGREPQPSAWMIPQLLGHATNEQGEDTILSAHHAVPDRTYHDWCTLFSLPRHDGMSFGDGGSLAVVILQEDLAGARYDRLWTDTPTG